MPRIKRPQPSIGETVVATPPSTADTTESVDHVAKAGVRKGLCITLHMDWR
jgi:hypothetical protein